jgi:hypothetical protein
MYVEDLIITLATLGKTNHFDTPMVDSLYDQLIRGIGFTEKQSNLAVRILKRYSPSLTVITQIDVSSNLENPTFRMTIRKLNDAKKISIVSNDQFTRAIKVEFPFDQVKIEHIRKHRSELDFAQWTPEEKAWMFSLTERNLQFIAGMSYTDSFEVDDEFDDFRNQIASVVGTMEIHVPMLTINNGHFEYVNASPYVPALQSTNSVSALFEARRAGISTWDDRVTEFLNQTNIDPVVKNFLLSDQSKPFEIDSEKEPVQCLTDLVKYMQPCLVIVPGGMELAKTKKIYDFLKSQGYQDDEISVLFRLSSGQGKEFNDFVKENNLNSPITEKTKFVFVSIKLPKPVVKSKMNFQSVISLGRSNVHYTIREFFKNRQNLIYYCEKSTQKEFNFGIL